MTIVADLFATLGLQVNESQFAAGSRRMKEMAATTDTAMTGLGRVAGGLVSRFAPLAAGLFGVNEIRKGIQDSLKWDESLTDLSISSGGVVTDLGNVTKEILQISNTTGVAKEQLLSGAQAFVTLTGDAKTARDSLLTFGRVSKAARADMSDVTGTAAAMSQSFEIAAPEMEKAFSILIAGGKAGSVELRDMAKVLAQIAPLTSEFKGGKGLEGLSSTGAALQLIARGTGGNANMAVTRLQALTTALTSKATQFEKDAKVKIFEKDLETGVKQRRNLMDIVNELSKSDLAKDPSKLIKSLGSIEAYNAYTQLVLTNGEWKDMAESTMKANDVAEDYAKRQASNSARLSNVFNQMKNFGFSAMNSLTTKVFATWDALMNGSFFKDWPTTWAGLWKAIGGGIDGAIDSWTDKFDGFSETILGSLGGVGEGIADAIGGAIDDADYNWSLNRRLLREEGQVRGLSGRALDQFVGQGVQNQVHGNPEAAKADVAWRQKYNDRNSVERGMYALKNTPNLTVTVNATSQASPEEIAQMVKDASYEAWNDQMRETDEGLEEP